jgi:hypothetical protein
MALIYLAAFWSLGVQVLGLVGSHGILPAADFLHFIARQEGGGRFWSAPTLCWLNDSDGFLLFLCWGGVGLYLLFLAGVAPALTAFLLWLFYLSLTVAAQDFLGFQWDNLLLESGFLLIFLFPQPLGIHLKPSVRPSIVVIWLLRWLLFKLMLESGLVKLLSGDVHWRHLTALTYHYWTQPLPHVISWYANQFPFWFQKFSCAVLFIIELVFPFFIFCGRWGRLIAFLGMVGLQLLIVLTGNYCFFNWLAIGLCLTLLEDEQSFKRLRATASVRHEDLRPLRLASLAQGPRNGTVLQGGIFYKILVGLMAVIVLTVNLGLVGHSFLRVPLPKPVEKLIVAVSPARSVNNYGLFAVMTTQRYEIVLEGSNDGIHWLPYEFPFKPGDIYRACRWTGLHQPRLDWQMWFAALGTWRENQWVIALMERLLLGEPSVVRLLASNPFGDHPPRYIQAAFWEYHFTDLKTKAANGAWWYREIKGLYCPTVSLR